jgi:hypothetical protein
MVWVGEMDFLIVCVVGRGRSGGPRDCRDGGLVGWTKIFKKMYYN